MPPAFVMPAPPQKAGMSSRRFHVSEMVARRTCALPTSRRWSGSDMLVRPAITDAGASLSRTIRPVSESRWVANVYFVPWRST